MPVAVLDIGKTNIKLLVLDAHGRILGQRSTPNRPLPGPPYLHTDVAAVEAWGLGALAGLGREHAIEAIVATAHGSGGVLVDDDGPALPMIDYEGELPPEVDAAYAAAMPPFLERGVHIMGGASHVGRQLFWQATQWPEAVARARAILTLPQYWAWRLSGVLASEVTSLAAQSHLWDVLRARPSRLVERMGWERLLPPLRPAWDRLGPILPRVAAATGLDPATPVLNGMHDSSGNLYRYQRCGLGDAALLSTGTWIVGLRQGLDPDRLVEDRGMSLNADVDGRPVGGVLGMVGREVELLTEGRPGGVTLADLQGAIDAGAMALPSFVAMDGMFPGSARRGRVVGPEVPRPALALLYGALMAEVCLELLEARGRAVIDGGFTGEPMFAQLVAALRPDLEVLVEPIGGGTAIGAALLCSHGHPSPPLQLQATSALALRGLRAYRDRWREAVAATATTIG